MSSKCVLNVIFLSVIFIIIVNGYAKDISGVERGYNRLNEYISHYETLSYDHEHIHASHNRAKRSVTKDHFVNLKFTAHGRNFHLRLKRDLNTFSNKLEILSSSDDPIEVSRSHIYEGVVIGDRKSYVFGSLLNGVFEGKIITERDAYYVENAKHYFPNRTATMRTTTMPTTSTATNSNLDSKLSTPAKTTTTRPAASLHQNSDLTADGFHSIIYHEKHVQDPYKDVREGHAAGCGITEEVSQWMENIQNSAVEEPEVLPKPLSKGEEQAEGMHKNFINNNTNTKKTTTKPSNVAEEDKVVNDAGDYDDKQEDVEEEGSGKKFKNSKLQKQQHPPHLNSPHTHLPKKNSNINSSNTENPLPSSSLNSNANEEFKYPYQKYSKAANFRGGAEWFPSSSSSPSFYNDYDSHMQFIPIDADWHERVHERVRRASSSTSSSSTSTSTTSSSSGNARSREDNKNTCSLYIQTDPLIWRHIREGIVDHDRGRKYEIDEKTREEILSLIAHHVTAVNYIYRNTKFDGRTEHRNIRFEVQRIKIDDDSACRNSYNGPHNAFCNEHMDVSNFLNLHSLEDHSDFCLAYVFTYRDFTGGTLGLAWVASASGASGGICEKYKTYTETVGGQYQSTKRSLNTGIITFVNYNSRVPPKVSQLTLAHEIGHNFGSPHDYPQECRPGGLNGNFIMFASATSGDRPNNSKFSPCSIRNISNVLDVLVGNLKRDCFKASEGAFCGNKIVESGEECDCGFNEEECKDNCCYPRLISEYDLSLNSSAKGCTRRAKTQCSPSQGPCCLSNSCTFVPSNYHVKCKEETECSWSSTCNGTTAECPEPKPRDDKTKCNNGTALCIKGDCSGSICLLWNMSECFLTSYAVPQVDKRKLCELACQNGNDTNTCRSTSEFAHLFDLPDGGISLRPGSPCDNFQGYCDVFLKCRAVDADGPLVRLKNLLLNKETLQTVAQWIVENWYIVVLMSIGFIIVMGIFIKCCAVHTPSSNPKKRRARRISETLRAPMNTLRRMRHPHSRSAGPRSIPPPVHEQRSRNHPPDWDRRHPDHRGGGHSVAIPNSSNAVVGHPSRPGGRSGVATSSGGGGGDVRRGRHLGASVAAGPRPANSSRSSTAAAAAAATGGPQHGRRSATSKL